MNRILSKLKEIFEAYTDYVVVRRQDLAVILSAYDGLKRQYDAYRDETERRKAQVAADARAKFEADYAHAATHRMLLENALVETREQVVALETAVLAAEHSKGTSYAERNHLVVLLAYMANALGWRAGVGTHEGEPLAGFDAIVRIDTPVGQLSWHIHDSQRSWLDNLPLYEGPWDGTTREQKYALIREMFGRI